MLNTFIAKILLVVSLGLGTVGMVSTQWIGLKSDIAQFLIARSWAQATEQEDKLKKPWPWADFNSAARLRWRDRTVYVMDRSTGEALAFGPGHLTQSAKLGELGRTMIAGHNDSHFAFLEDLQLGDFLDLEITPQRHKRYKIESIEIVDSRTKRLQHSTLDNELVLITCYPFNGLTLDPPWRMLVTAILQT